MKRTLLLLLSFVVTWANAQSNLTLSEAKEIANTYYGSLQQMAKHPIGEAAVQNETKLLDVLGSDIHGKSISGVFRVPDDLAEMSGKPHVDNSSVLITNYIGDFLRIAEDKKLDFSYKVLSSEYQRGPELKKGEVSPSFACVVVQKTMKSPSTTTVLVNDTMFINAESKSIAMIRNRYRKLSWSNMESMTIEELLIEAQNKYSNRRYDEAFRLYQKALEKDPRNAEASYSLGVMCFKGEGCKQYPRKVRDYLVDFYWQKSDKGILELMRNYNTQMVVLKAYSGNEIDPFPSNRLLTHDYRNHKFGYISKQGKMVIKQQYKKGYPFFANGTAIVLSDKDEWFLIDTMGRVKDVYLRVKALEGGKQLLVHKKEDKSGVVNRKTGEWEIPVDNRITGWLYVNGEPKCYWIFKDGKYGLISSSNTIIVPVKYNNIKVVEFDDIRKTLLCDYDESKYEQLQKQYEKGSEIPIIKRKEIGKVVVPFVAKCTALVSSDEEKWLLIDSKGKVNSIYENSWPSFMPIKERRYLVTKKNGKTGVLDRKTGEEVVPFIYQNATMSWDDEYFRVLFVNDKSTYERLQKKYDYKIPEDELKKIGTLYKLPLNKDL